MSKERPTGTTLRLEDDLLEGRTVVIRVNPSDPASSGVLNEDNPLHLPRTGLLVAGVPPRLVNYSASSYCGARGIPFSEPLDTSL